MTDPQIHARAIIAAALIQSRVIDPDWLGSGNKDVSDHKVKRLRELVDRIYNAIVSDHPPDT